MGRSRQRPVEHPVTTELMPNIYVAHHQQPPAQVVIRRMQAAFGASSVAHSSMSLPPGEDARKAAAKYAARADVVLVVIGPDWAQHMGQSPQNDLVGIAAAYAIRYERRLIPVLLQGATMPSARTLPEALASLAHRSPYVLNDVEDDTVRLITLLQRDSQPDAPMRTSRPTAEPIRYVAEPLPSVTTPISALLWPFRFVWWLMKRILGSIAWLVKVIVAQAVRSVVGCIVTLAILAVVGGLGLWFVVTFVQNDLNAAQALANIGDSISTFLQSLPFLQQIPSS